MKAVVERYLPPLSFTRLLSLVANVGWLKKLWRGIQTDNGPRLKPHARRSGEKYVGLLQLDEPTFTQLYILISYRHPSGL